MKTVLVFIISFTCCISATCQNKNLSKMETKERNEFLLKIAKEATDIFGPGWYQGTIIPDISDVKIYNDEFDMRPEIQKNNGRKYYTVKFWYDEKTKKEIGWSYASKVDVWEDNGEPLSIIFGDTYGIGFEFIPYGSRVKAGVLKEQQRPFRKFKIII